MATLSAVQVQTPSGAIDIKIYGRSIIAGANLSFEVLDVGRLVFKNEIPSSDENASSISTEQGKIELTIYDTLSNSNSLKELLDASFLPSNIYEILDVDFIFTPTGASALSSRYALKYENYKHSAGKKEVTLTLAPKIIFNKAQIASSTFFTVGTGTIASTGTAVTGTGTAFTTELVEGDWLLIYFSPLLYARQVVSIASNTALTIDRPLTATTVNFSFGNSIIDISMFDMMNRGGTVNDFDIYLTAGDPDFTVTTMYKVIQRYLGLIFDSATVYINSSFRNSDATKKLLRENPTNTQTDIFAVGDGAGGNKASDIIARISALEGSVYGNVFGRSYYSYRLDNGATDTTNLRYELDWDKVLELEDESGKTVLGSVSVTAKTGSFQTPTISPSVVSSESFNAIASQFFSVEFSPQNLGQGTYATGTDSIGGGTSTALITDLVYSGKEAYAKCLGADGAQRFTVKYFGVAQVLPYHRLTFSASTPDRYEKEGANKRQFAISSISYDFVQNMTEIKIYQIGTI